MLKSDFLVLVVGLIVFLLFIDRRVAPPKEWTPVAGRLAVAQVHSSPNGEIAIPPDPENGRSLFGQTCTACHGANAQGLPHMGVDLRASKFVAQQTDVQLLSFLKTGRQPKDPKSVRGLLMPARGGNSSLVDMELYDIVAFLRVVQRQSAMSSPTTRPTLTRAQQLYREGSREN